MNELNLIDRFQAQFDTGTIGKSNQHSPTPESIKFIEHQLNIVLPQTFIELASRCLTYTHWFAGIGLDYEWQSHILTFDREFHNGGEDSWPRNLISFTQGYDAMYNCFDLNNLDENCNMSIVRCELSYSSDSIEIIRMEYVDRCFDTYLDRLLSYWEEIYK